VNSDSAHSVSRVALARELEQSQQLAVALQLSVDDLQDELARRATWATWLPLIVFLLEMGVIALIVFAFEPTRYHP
jgi:hypothetical protein